MRTANDQNKVVSYNQYRKRSKAGRMNVGLLVFAVIFIYIVVYIFLFVRSDKIAGYEVREGSLAVSNSYRALAVREETLFYAETSGYVNYYVREGERTGVGNIVYSIDENHHVHNSDYAGDTGHSLSDHELEELRGMIGQFQNSMTDNEFSRVYRFENTLEGTLLKYENYTLLDDLASLNGLSGRDGLHISSASKTGIVAYYVDGYEGCTVDDIQNTMFDESTYEKTILYNNAIVEPEDPVYKLTRKDTWNLVIQLNEFARAQLADKSRVRITFPDSDTTSLADFYILQRPDGVYGVMTLYDSMQTYVSDRFINIEIETEEERGLKIPVSSIVEKEFFMIPKEYIIKGGRRGKEGINRRTYDEKGNMTGEFIEVTIYATTDEECYVDKSTLRIGDIIMRNDSPDSYTITKSGTLIGVYNMNKGYADFRQISILYQNSEYAIVKSNTPYGLIAYDRIVLDASTVSDDDFVY